MRETTREISPERRGGEEPAGEEMASTTIHTPSTALPCNNNPKPVVSAAAVVENQFCDH